MDDFTLTWVDPDNDGQYDYTILAANYSETTTGGVTQGSNIPAGCDVLMTITFTSFNQNSIEVSNIVFTDDNNNGFDVCNNN